MNILITGAAGFIGSHTAVELLAAGHYTVLLDNFSNSSPAVLERIAEISGRRAPFYQGDIRDRALLRRVFAEQQIDSVIHFAALKAVGESVQKPLEYYDNNVCGSLVLFEEMAAAGVFSIVFSSSATVYGNPARVPIDETMPTGATTNPYGTSKHIIETVLRDLAAADMRWSAVLLRYFNPVGAHPSGLIGEDPKGIPNNLMPYITQVAIGKRDVLHVFGDDYPTPDGTCQRDYIHVVDLAQGHVEALRWMEGRHGIEAFNLGSGEGTSVLELVHAFSRACGHDLPYVVDGRRDGDLPAFWADPTKAKREMGWQTKLGIDRMCEDSWRWQSMNPDGFEG